MILSFRRLHYHALEFGYLTDRQSGAVLRGFGRHLVRTTADYPAGCLPVAVPGRLASHVGALPNVIDPDHETAGALIVSPSYRILPSGDFAGAWVTLQRIRLDPHEDARGEPGDAVRSHAAIVAFDDFGWHAPSLHETIAALRAERVSNAEPREARIGRARQSAPVDGATATVPAPELAVRAIVGAVATGATLRLDRRWCATEDEFVSAYLAALVCLPMGLRGHVSAAAGLGAPDVGFQIAWCRDAFGLDPASAQAAALVDVGADLPSRLDQEGFAVLPGDSRFASSEGLVSATLAVPHFHVHVRRAVRDRIATARGGEAPSTHRAILPRAAERLFAEVGAKSGREVLNRTLGSDAAGVAMVLAGVAPATVSLDDVATALDICEAAAGPFEDERVRRARRVATTLACAKFAAAIVPGTAMMQMVAARPALARAIAGEVAAGNARIMRPVRRALAALRGQHGADSAEHRRAAGHLLPRDHQIVTVWGGYRDNSACLAEALFDLATGDHNVEDNCAQVVAEALIKGGRWNIVREALQQAVSRLGWAQGQAPSDMHSQRRRLQLISGLSGVLQRKCEMPWSHEGSVTA